MTKAQLIEDLKNFPDDTKIVLFLKDEGETVELENYGGEDRESNFVLYVKNN